MLKVNSVVDWDKQRKLAEEGKFDDIDSGVFIRNYSSITKIAAAHNRPKYRPNVEVHVHWGVSGSGKSHKVFTELEGLDYYVKNSSIKWWDGYKGEDIVVMDEFRGRIDISYLLLWFDKYPANAEIKGSVVPLNATKFYLMSNIEPNDWYPELDLETKGALLRRLTTVTQWRNKYVERDLDEELNLLFNDYCALK